jgi:hypothetical protein
LRGAFSLIELVAVMAVMLLLVSLLFPVVGSVRRAALRVNTLARYSQWVAALESYRMEYGLYPFGKGAVDAAYELNVSAESVRRLERVLSGEDRVLNPGGRFFMRFQDEDRLRPGDPDSPIVDAFGNAAVYILMDHSGDRRIQVPGFEEISAGVAVWSRPDEALGYSEIATWKEGVL